MEKGVKSRAESAVTAVYHAVQKSEPLSGISRTYRPKDDDGDQLPAEFTRVQVTVPDLLASAQKAWVDLLDITAQKDVTNTTATADVVVDGSVLVAGAPVPFLIFLEKKLDDVRAVLAKMPVLDPSETWTWDDNAAAYATVPRETTKSKKVLRNHIKAEATDKHPAQVEVYTEDEIVGFWTTVKFSGAIPQARLNELRDRVNKLQDAVKRAREQANSADVPSLHIGQPVVDWLFA